MNQGERIKKARIKKGLSQQQLAEMLNVPQQTISNYERNIRGSDFIDKEFFKNLAKTLNVTTDWILTGLPSLIIDGKSTTGKPVDSPSTDNLFPIIEFWIPVISWDDIDSWLQSGNIEMVEVMRKVPMFDDASRMSFGLCVKDNSMHNPGSNESFNEGDVLAIDPELKPQDGDYVLAKIPSLFPFYFFRKLSIENETQKLVALNPNFAPIVLDDACEFKGVVVDHIRSLRRK